MSLLSQIIWGTVTLSACAVIHVSLVASIVPVLGKAAAHADARFPKLKVTILVGLSFVMIVFAHTVQIWLWALAFMYVDALNTLESAVYFSLVTYTTLGYGDVTLQDDLRIFGAFASVTGLLTFGLSTAFLVGLVTRILPQSFAGD